MTRIWSSFQCFFSMNNIMNFFSKITFTFHHKFQLGSIFATTCQLEGNKLALTINLAFKNFLHACFTSIATLYFPNILKYSPYPTSDASCASFAQTVETSRNFCALLKIFPFLTVWINLSSSSSVGPWRNTRWYS